eukprot:8921537-Pyramimonas_sp.AAC.1
MMERIKAKEKAKREQDDDNIRYSDARDTEILKRPNLNMGVVLARERGRPLSPWRPVRLRHCSVAASLMYPLWHNIMVIPYQRPLKTESVSMTVHAAAETERGQEQGLSRAAKVERRQEQGLNHMTETAFPPGTASERGQEQGPNRAVAAERRQEQGLNRMME